MERDTPPKVISIREESYQVSIHFRAEVIHHMKVFMKKFFGVIYILTLLDVQLNANRLKTFRPRPMSHRLKRVGYPLPRYCHCLLFCIRNSLMEPKSFHPLYKQIILDANHLRI